jgi:hypothetical protein
MNPSSKTGYQYFTQLVEQAVLELRAAAPSQGTEAWYVLQQLEHLAGNVSSSSSAMEVANSTRALGRLWIDLSDDRNLYARRISEIVRVHQDVLRAERRSRSNKTMEPTR